ncbi:MAG: hypothetical protein ACYCSH_14405 [Acidithiobacillus sp.]
MAAKKKELFSDDDRYIVEWQLRRENGLYQIGCLSSRAWSFPLQAMH